MLKLFVKIIFLIFIQILTFSHALTVKIGILDDFFDQKYVSTNYKVHYLREFLLARAEALKIGIDVQYEIFKYENGDESLMLAQQQLLFNKEILL